MLVEDVVRTVRGNVQPGDIILAIVSSGADDRGEERRRRSTTCLAKVEKGASVTLRMKRGEQEFFATFGCENGE